jgi:hypothetical protein
MLIQKRGTGYSRSSFLSKKTGFNASAQWQLSRTKQYKERKIYYLETDK